MSFAKEVMDTIIYLQDLALHVTCIKTSKKLDFLEKCFSPIDIVVDPAVPDGVMQFWGDRVLLDSRPIKSDCESCGGLHFLRDRTSKYPATVACLTCMTRDPENPFGPWIEKGQP